MRKMDDVLASMQIPATVKFKSAFFNWPDIRLSAPKAGETTSKVWADRRQRVNAKCVTGTEGDERTWKEALLQMEVMLTTNVFLLTGCELYRSDTLAGTANKERPRRNVRQTIR